MFFKSLVMRIYDVGLLLKSHHGTWDAWIYIDYRMTNFTVSKLSEDLSSVGILSSQCDEKELMMLLSIGVVADVDYTKLENGKNKEVKFILKNA